MRVHATSADGLWSVLEGIDYPAGIGRSRTAKTPGEALKATYDPLLVTPPGANSMFGRYVLVRTMDISSHPNYIPPVPGLPVSAKSYLPGTVGGKKFIPDYPHKCLVCGGNVLVLFSSTEHEGGECPGPPKKMRIR